MRKQSLVFTFFVLLLFYSCSSSSDKTGKYIGTWRDNNSQVEIVITQVGQNFSVSQNGRTFPASYNKEQDRLEVSSGSSPVMVIYDPKTDHLIGPFGEFERVKN